jgi:hypothetical protein
LLFFAVSMTDDLHYEMVLSEESSTSRRNLSCSPGTQPSPQSGTVPHGSCPAVGVHFEWVAPALAREKIAPPVTRSASDLQSRRMPPRAPPVFSL